MSAPPKEVRNIGRAINSQDNRCTDQPIFIVQQKRTYVGSEGYNHDARIEWRRDDSDSHALASPSYAKSLERNYRETYEVKAGWIRFSVFDVWEFVTACFTENGCKAYLATNGHNLKETRIYAEGSYRNEEFRSVRDYLRGLASQPDSQEKK